MYLLRTAVYLIAALLVQAELTIVAYAQSTSAWPYVAQVDIFKLHSNFQLDDQAAVESILGELRSDICGTLQLEPQKSVIHVVLFGSVQEYGRYMRHYFPFIAPRRAIYLQDRGPGMLFAFWHQDIANDLRHEATHAVLNQSGVQLPLWLDEGVAEYFEIAKDHRFASNPYLPAVKQRLVEGLIPPLMELERIEHMHSFTDQHYRDSWAWIHFLLHRHEQTRQLLIDYITRHRRQIPQALLSRQLAQLIADPIKDFQEHFSLLDFEEATSP